MADMSNLPARQPHSESTSSRTTPLTKLKRASQKIKSTDDWGAIQRLSDLSLAPDVTQLFLDRSQAESILTGELIPNPMFKVSASVNSSSNDTAMENLVHACLMSKMAKQTSTLMTIRWLFLLLLVGDIAITLSPETPSLKERIEAYVSGESGRAGKGEGKGKAILMNMDTEDTTRIIEMGRNLAFICDTLGTGCIFYLWESLTDNFLRFRVTRRGRHFLAAKSNLDRLGLRQKIEADGSDDLATSIRHQLKKKGGGQVGEDRGREIEIEEAERDESDEDEGDKVGEDWEGETEIEEAERDESDGDDVEWGAYAIGLGFSVAARTGEMTEDDDIEE